MMTNDRYDITRSDVRIRVFDTESSKDLILRKLEQNSSKLQQLFTSYFLYVSINLNTSYY